MSLDGSAGVVALFEVVTVFLVLLLPFALGAAALAQSLVVVVGRGLTLPAYAVPQSVNFGCWCRRSAQRPPLTLTGY